MIAVPVTAPGDADGLIAMRVCLPEGTRTDFFTGDTYRVGGWQDMTRPLDSFPLLMKGGGFFVLDGADPANSNSTALPAWLGVHITGGTGIYDLTEDGPEGRTVTRFATRQLSEA